MKNLHLTLVPLGIALMVAGCGGGGSSSSGGGGIPTAAVKITSSNAPTVAGGTNAATQSTAAQGRSTASIATGVVTQQTKRLPSVLQIVNSGYNLALNTKFPATVVGVVTSATVSCTDFTTAAAQGAANTLTLSANVANSGTTTVGDSISFSYTSCVNTATGDTSNGSMTFAISSLSGAYGSATSAGLTATFANFSVSASGATETLNGDMTINASVSGTTTTSTISGSSLRLDSSIDGSFLMTNYDETYVFDSATNAYSYSSNMTLAGSAMGGSVTVTTAPGSEFTGDLDLNNGNPTAGSMTITGAPATTGGNNTYVTLTANADGSATLTVFDGTSTTNTPVSWTEL